MVWVSGCCRSVFTVWTVEKKIGSAIAELRDILDSWPRFVQESGIEASDRLAERHSEIFSGLLEMMRASR